MADSICSPAKAGAQGFSAVSLVTLGPGFRRGARSQPRAAYSFVSVSQSFQSGLPG
jgi:hypothetical protein